MGYGSAMRNITGGSAIEWTADPANRALQFCAEYSDEVLWHVPLGNRVCLYMYILYVNCNCILYLRVCMPDISRYGMCIVRLRVFFLR